MHAWIKKIDIEFYNKKKELNVGKSYIFLLSFLLSRFFQQTVF
jgi:hypothetical protein